VASQLVFACSFFQPIPQVTEKSSLQNQRSANAELELLELAEIDVLIRLDSRQLREQFTRQLNSLQPTPDWFQFHKLKIRFDRQYIALDAVVEITDNNGNLITASAVGNISLAFWDQSPEMVSPVQPSAGQLYGFQF